MTKVINLFSGPGTGKSTAAAGLFYVLKIMGYNVELVSEYAKQMTWEGRHNILTDQLYILAKQNRSIERLRGKVDYVITDSPLLIGMAYVPEDYYPTFSSIMLDVWDSYHNISFLLQNTDTLPYQTVGRNQTASESKLITEKIVAMLARCEIPYVGIDVVPHVMNPFKNHIAEILKNVVEKPEDINFLNQF